MKIKYTKPTIEGGLNAFAVIGSDSELYGVFRFKGGAENYQRAQVGGGQLVPVHLSEDGIKVR